MKFLNSFLCLVLGHNRFHMWLHPKGKKSTLYIAHWCNRCQKEF